MTILWRISYGDVSWKGMGEVYGIILIQSDERRSRLQGCKGAW